MKRIIFSLLLAGSVFAVKAQDNTKFEAAMTKNISLIDSAFVRSGSGDLSGFEVEANTFERIGAAEKDKWQPYYYAAYCQVMEALYSKDPAKVDAFADKRHICAR